MDVESLQSVGEHILGSLEVHETGSVGTVINLKKVQNINHLEVETYKLARREAGERLKRRTKNHGASNQTKSITK